MWLAYFRQGETQFCSYIAMRLIGPGSRLSEKDAPNAHKSLLTAQIQQLANMYRPLHDRTAKLWEKARSTETRLSRRNVDCICLSVNPVMF